MCHGTQLWRAALLLDSSLFVCVLFASTTAAAAAPCNAKERQSMVQLRDRESPKLSFTESLFFLYGVASVSRIDGIIGLLCKRSLQKRLYSAKETYNLIEPTY